jgi:hypothetical protein
MSIAGNAREQGPESKEKGYQKKKRTKGTRKRKGKGDLKTGISVLRGGEEKGRDGMYKRRRDWDIHVWGTRGRTEISRRTHKQTSERAHTHAHSYNMLGTSATR